LFFLSYGEEGGHFILKRLHNLPLQVLRPLPHVPRNLSRNPFVAFSEGVCPSSDGENFRFRQRQILSRAWSDRAGLGAWNYRAGRSRFLVGVDEDRRKLRDDRIAEAAESHAIG
jgi:hypothetical protein